jgi:hypothetical protein
MSVTTKFLPGLLTLLAANACVLDRQLGESVDEARSEELQLACEEEQSGQSEPEPEGYLTAPSGIAPCTAIVDLTASERTAWCEWNASVDPYNGAGPETPTEDGHVLGGVSHYAQLGDREYCTQNIAVEPCRANLVISECHAPLITIERCVRRMFEAHDAFEDVCAELAELESCATTIVQQHVELGCPVPVE